MITFPPKSLETIVVTSPNDAPGILSLKAPRAWRARISGNEVIQGGSDPGFYWRCLFGSLSGTEHHGNFCTGTFPTARGWGGAGP